MNILRIYKFTLSFLTLCLISVLLTNPLLAAEPVSKSRISGVVIDGHDTVAYHNEAAIQSHIATKGKKTYTVEWKGAKWRFAKAEHAEAFRQDPEKYSPAYNGHCANALSLGEGLIRTDGTHWEILDDQLYVFYAARGRTRWNDGNWKQYKADADRAWKEIVANQ